MKNRLSTDRLLVTPSRGAAYLFENETAQGVARSDQEGSDAVPDSCSPPSFCKGNPRGPVPCHDSVPSSLAERGAVRIEEFPPSQVPTLVSCREPRLDESHLGPMHFKSEGSDALPMKTVCTERLGNALEAAAPGEASSKVQVGSGRKLPIEPPGLIEHRSTDEH